MENNFDWKRYFVVFLITSGLFVSAFYLSNYFNNKRINQLKSIQDKIAIDILSSETQFSLLSDLSCKNISGSFLASELEELGNKLEWSERNLSTKEEIANLKGFYFLLEIKDYLLMKKIAERCQVKSSFILYFYTDLKNCPDCTKQGFVLSALKNKYPELRIYSFNYSTDLSVIKTLLQIYKIKDTELPALVFNDTLLTGFQSIDSLEELIKAELIKTEKVETAGKTKEKEAEIKNQIKK